MDITTYISAQTRHIEELIRADIDNWAKTCEPILAEICAYGLLSAGKRIRPVLAVLSARLCGGEQPWLYAMAVGFEYLHTATLFHDDIIDGAKSRRGQIPVAGKYGVNATILAGDYLHTVAIAHISKYCGDAGVTALSRATRAMVSGEFTQQRLIGDIDQSEADYFSVITAKTAVLLGASCEIGALAAGATAKKSEALYRYGLTLGRAYQIIDDILDYIGTSGKTGKVVGNDLAEGKITLPLLRAYERANRHDKDKLRGIVASPDRRRRDFAEVVRILNDYDGFGAARQAAAREVDRARAALRECEVGADSESLAMLTELCEFILTRQK
jgi:octaprenyl-diphosphate synthase